MRRLTLIPAIALFAVLCIHVIGLKVQFPNSLGPVGAVLFLILPLISLLEFVAFAYDFKKTKNKYSRPFLVRLFIHLVASVWAAFIVIFAAVLMYSGGPFHL